MSRRVLSGPSTSTHRARRCLRALDPSRDHSRADRFCQNDCVAGTGAGVCGNTVRIDHAGNGVAEHDLFVIDAVTADERDLILSQHRQPAAHNILQNGKVHTLLGKAGYGHRRQRRAAHGPDVID